MNVAINIGWKFVLAAGAAFSMMILAAKLDSVAAERVSNRAIDAVRDVECVIHTGERL